MTESDESGESQSVQTAHAELVQRLFDHLQAGTTDAAASISSVEASTYLDRDHTQLEIARIFRTHPVIAACTSELPNPGSFVNVEIVGTLTLIVRQDDGRVRAFANSCRHRGTPLTMDCSGQASHFSCPYHGWRYAADGSLSTVPYERRSFTDIDKGAFGLVEFPVAERHGFVWVVPAQGRDLDLTAYLGPVMDAELATYGLSTWELMKSESFDQPMNWKVVADGILDVLHVPWVHPETVSKFMNSSCMVFDRLNERSARLAMPKRSIRRLEGTDGVTDDPSRYLFLNYIVLPSTAMVFQSRHFEVWTFQPHPSEPGRSLTTIRILVSPDFPDREAKEAYAEENWKNFMRVAYEEDWGTARSLQKGLEGRQIDRVYFGRDELAPRFLHEYLAGAMQEKPPASSH